MSKLNAIRIDTKDNVVTAITTIQKGEAVLYSAPSEQEKLFTLDNINLGHKIAIKKIAEGSHIYKYGESIGTATKDILPGQHVHIQNIMSNRGRGDLR